MGWLSDLLFGDNGRNSELSKAKSVNKSGHPFARVKSIYDSPFAEECGVTADAFFECDGLIYNISWVSYMFDTYASIKSLDGTFDGYSYKSQSKENKNKHCFGNARKLTIDEYKKIFNDEESKYVGVNIIKDVILKYSKNIHYHSLEVKYDTVSFKFLDLYHITYDNELFIFNGDEVISKLDLYRQSFDFSTYYSDHKSKVEYDYVLFSAHLEHIGKDKFIDTIIDAKIEYVGDTIDGVDLKSIIEKYEIKLIKAEYDQIDEFIQDVLDLHQQLNNKLDANEILKLVDIVDYDTLILFIKNIHNYKNVVDVEKLGWRGQNTLSERNRMHIEQYLKGIV